jgi:hypothetical protein
LVAAARRSAATFLKSLGCFVAEEGEALLAVFRTLFDFGLQ